MMINTSFLLKDTNEHGVSNNKYDEVLKGNESVAKQCNTEFSLELGKYNGSIGSGIGGYGIDLI